MYICPNVIWDPADDFDAMEAPFGILGGAPAALMVTEGFRMWSPFPDVEPIGVLPLTMPGPPTAGTAGGIATLAFTGELVSFLVCGADPTAGVVEPDDVGGWEEGFLVALA